VDKGSVGLAYLTRFDVHSLTDTTYGRKEFALLNQAGSGVRASSAAVRFVLLFSYFEAVG
jgi:hypothetical protein